MDFGTFFSNYLISLVIRFPVIVLYIIATIWEYRSASTIMALAEANSVCIWAHEISSAVALYIMFCVCPIVPNVCYVIGIFLLPRLCREPVTIVYNAAMGTMLITGCLILDGQLTMCGNIDQRKINTNIWKGFTAGILHMINAIYTHCALPWDESYLRHRQK